MEPAAFVAPEPLGRQPGEALAVALRLRIEPVFKGDPRAAATVATSAFITDGSPPAQPASPQPFAPRTLVVAGTGWNSCAKGGRPPRGSA